MSNANINQAKKDILKKFGEGAIFNGNDIVVEVLPTGITTLDTLFNYGGPKRGSIIEIYGRELSGKTTMCLITTANIQKQGGTVVYLDREGKMDLSWAQTLGVNIDDLLVSYLSDSEDVYQAALDIARSGVADAIILDSLVAGLPKVDSKKEDMNVIVGTPAKINNMFFMRWCSVMNNLNQRILQGEKLHVPLLIFTNQIREKIVTMGDAETRSGGRGKDHVTCTRIKLRPKGFINAEGDLLGTLSKDNKVASHGVRINGFLEKHQSGIPYQDFEFQVFYDSGFDKIFDTIQHLLDTDQINLAGAWYSSEELFGEKKYQGMSGLRKAMIELNLV